jgi:hypothetical protein
MAFNQSAQSMAISLLSVRGRAVELRCPIWFALAFGAKPLDGETSGVHLLMRPLDDRPYIWRLEPGVENTWQWPK